MECFLLQEYTKDVTVITNCSHQRSWVRPEGTQEGKNTCHLAAIKLQSFPTKSPEETWM